MSKPNIHCPGQASSSSTITKDFSAEDEAKALGLLNRIRQRSLNEKEGGDGDANQLGELTWDSGLAKAALKILNKCPESGDEPDLERAIYDLDAKLRFGLGRDKNQEVAKK